LSVGPNGFFLLVEGSNIDVAGHQNDPAANFRDALAYDSAFEVVVQFANTNGNTFVVSTSDHETGGLTLGIGGSYDYNPNVLLKVNASAIKMASLIHAGGEIFGILYQYAGINLTTSEFQAIQNASNDIPATTVVIGNIIAKRTGLGWSTTGHTGVDVNLYATGYKADQLFGNYNNRDVGSWVAQMFNLDLAAETEKLKNFCPNSSIQESVDQFFKGH